MALLPSSNQIPAQRVPLNERPAEPEYFAREWFRFFDLLHTFTPTTAVFTPVFTPVTNVTAVTGGGCFFNQMGNVVALTGSFTLDPAAAGDTVFRMDPPVLEGFTLAVAAGMFVTTASGASDTGSVIAASNLLEFRLNAVNTGAAAYVFNVNYQIA